MARPAKDTVAVLLPPPFLDIIGVAPLTFEGNLPSPVYDGNEDLVRVTISGVRQTQVRVLFGSETKTFT